MPASNFVQRQTLDLWFRGQTAAPPTVAYVALYTTNPTGADAGTEVTGGGYVRMPAQFAAAQSQGNLSAMSNANKIEFPEATTPWGRVAYLGIRDAQAEGRLLYYTPLATSIDVAAGTSPRFDAGSITVTLE